MMRGRVTPLGKTAAGVPPVTGAVASALAAVPSLFLPSPSAAPLSSGAPSSPAAGDSLALVPPAGDASVAGVLGLPATELPVPAAPAAAVVAGVVFDASSEHA